MPKLAPVPIEAADRTRAEVKTGAKSDAAQAQHDQNVLQNTVPATMCAELAMMCELAAPDVAAADAMFGRLVVAATDVFLSDLAVADLGSAIEQSRVLLLRYADKVISWYAKVASTTESTTVAPLTRSQAMDIRKGVAVASIESFSSDFSALWQTIEWLCLQNASARGQVRTELPAFTVKTASAIAKETGIIGVAFETDVRLAVDRLKSKIATALMDPTIMRFAERFLVSRLAWVQKVAYARRYGPDDQSEAMLAALIEIREMTGRITSGRKEIPANPAGLYKIAIQGSVIQHFDRRDSPRSMYLKLMTIREVLEAESREAGRPSPTDAEVVDYFNTMKQKNSRAATKMDLSRYEVFELAAGEGVQHTDLTPEQSAAWTETVEDRISAVRNADHPEIDDLVAVMLCGLARESNSALDLSSYMGPEGLWVRNRDEIAERLGLPAARVSKLISAIIKIMAEQTSNDGFRW